MAAALPVLWKPCRWSLFGEYGGLRLLHTTPKKSENSASFLQLGLPSTPLGRRETAIKSKMAFYINIQLEYNLTLLARSHERWIINGNAKNSYEMSHEIISLLKPKLCLPHTMVKLLFGESELRRLIFKSSIWNLFLCPRFSFVIVLTVINKVNDLRVLRDS